MKRTLAIVLMTILIGLFLCTHPRAEGIRKHIVSADADWVIHIDTERLMSSRVFSRMQEEDKWDRIEIRNSRITRKFGINLMKDVTAVTLYGRGENEDSAVICITGRFDKEHLMDLLDLADTHREIPHGAFTIHSWDHDQYGVFAADGMVLLGRSEEMIKTALDVIAGKRKSIDGDLDAAALPPDSLIAVFARNLNNLIKKREKPRIFKKAETARLSISERGDDLHIGGSLSMTSAEDAEDIEQIMRGMAALADLYREELPPDFDFGERLQIKRTGNSVSVELDYPIDELVDFLAGKSRIPFFLVLAGLSETLD